MENQEKDRELQRDDIESLPQINYDDGSIEEGLPPQLTAYFKEIASYPMLDQEEEIALAKQIGQGGTEGKKAEEKMVLSNLRLVVYVAKRYESKYMEPMDIIQYGNLGLIQAVRRFDYRKGNRFSTYAIYWIQQSISRNLANFGNLIRVPACRTENLMKIFKARRELRDENKTEPTNKEIAERLGISEEKLAETITYIMTFISTDDFVKGEDSERPLLSEYLADKRAEEPEEAVMVTARRDAIMSALNDLPGRDRDIMIRRCGLNGRKPETLEMIACDYGLSRERVRQIERDILEKFRKPKYRKRLEDFAYA